VTAAAGRVPATQVPHPTLWTNSYFVATTDDATLEIVKHYVENQRNV
jgi:REP element-mobilizing transposase RayT